MGCVMRAEVDRLLLVTVCAGLELGLDSDSVLCSCFVRILHEDDCRLVDHTIFNLER